MSNNLRGVVAAAVVLALSLSGNSSQVTARRKSSHVALPQHKSPATGAGLLGTIHSNNRIDWLTFCPDGQTLAAVSNRDVHLFRLRDGILLFTLRGHTDSVRSIVFSPDGDTIASSSNDKTVRLWSTRNGKLLSVLQAGDYSPELTFSPDGKLLASLDWNSIKLWGVDDGKLVRTLPRGGYGKLAFTPNGKNLVAGEREYLYFIQSSDGKTSRTLKTPSPGTDIGKVPSFSTDGRTLAVGHLSGGGPIGTDFERVDFWQVDTGRLLRRLKLRLVRKDDKVTSVVFSPDLKLAAASTPIFTPPTIQLWRLSDGALLKSFQGNCVAFSPDGTVFAIGDNAGAIKLWQIQDKTRPTSSK